jgi:integrase
MTDKKTRHRSTFYFEGKRYEATGKTQKEADQKAALKIDKLIRGETSISGNMTVSAWAKEWLETYKKPVCGENQYQRYTSYIKNIITPSIGNLMIKNVTDLHLQKILNSRAGKSKSDLLKLYNALRSIFKRAYMSKPKLISYNPAENLELPAATDGTHRSVTEYEYEKILALAETHHAGLWIKILLYAGLRPCETRALEWRDIDFDKNCIRVNKGMKASTKIIGTTKSEAGTRIVPIHENLLPCLQSAKSNNPFEPVLLQPQGGKRHTKSSMRCLWNNFKRNLDISMGAKVKRNEIILSVVAKDLVPYCLRHTYCTRLQDAGVPINVARVLMGHEDIATTSKIYTHTSEAILQEMANKMNEYDRSKNEKVKKQQL